MAAETCDSDHWDLDGEGTDGCEHACTESGDEACDGPDNDCDGETDEDFDLQTDTTRCGTCDTDCAGVGCATRQQNAYRIGRPWSKIPIELGAPGEKSL